MSFPAVLNLSTLDGTNGFQLTGAAVGDYSGWAVSGIGDFNGDGYADFIIGADYASPNGTRSGASYLVFGRASGFPADLSLTSLNGSNGLRLTGMGLGNHAGYSVNGAGDVNGDGFDDVILGTTAVGAFVGSAAYVVFGKASGFSASFPLSSLDGANGFRVDSVSASMRVGHSVASAGDINGDGYGDIIIGGPRAAAPGAYSGISYVVFGKAAGFDAILNPGSLNGTNGFAITAAAGERLGTSVAAGDVNGDGFDDLIVGAIGTGSFVGGAYVIFGRSNGFTATLNVSSLSGLPPVPSSGVAGFRIVGPATRDYIGASVASAGDINGDGFADMIVGGSTVSDNGHYSGATYVVFGKASGFGATVNVSTLDGANGFRIVGSAANDLAGWDVSSAGDVNADGYDDLIVGAPFVANSPGTGAAFVIYGRAGGFSARLDLSALNGEDGFRINGETAGSRTGLSVSAAGDVNGDGIDDILVGAPYGASRAGASYVIFGQPSAITFTGNASDESFTGGVAADTLSGGGGKDVLDGAGGNDMIDGGDANDTLIGGAGADDIIGGLGNDWLQGDDGNDELDGGDGADKLFGGDGLDLLTGGAANDRMDGGAGSDTLNGDAANDYLDGGAGADVMRGGAGNDIYIVDDTNDQVIELADEGFDIVRTSLDGWVVGANVEGLELQGGGDIDGVGNAGANNLQGNSGANVLSGLGGVDTINGNDGDDTIVGGAGNDLMRGGIGADGFVVGAESLGGAVLETDQLFDFSAAEGDYIDLSGIDANSRVDGDQGFRLVSAFSKHDAAHPELTGQMTLSFAGGITTLRLDVNGDAKVDYQMKINGDVRAETADWIL